MTAIKTILGDRLRVVRLRPTTEGRFHLTEHIRFSQELAKPGLWRVLEIGPDCTLKSEIRPGDRILTHHYSQGPTDLGNDTALITSDQVLAVFPATNNQFHIAAKT